MAVERISFSGPTLVVGERRFLLAHDVADAFRSGHALVVLFDPDSLANRFGQFPNLVAIDESTGEQVWEAELPSSTTGDRYYKVGSREPLIAYSVKSFVCTIDTETGAITESEFVK